MSDHQTVTGTFTTMGAASATLYLRDGEAVDVDLTFTGAGKVALAASLGLPAAAYQPLQSWEATVSGARYVNRSGQDQYLALIVQRLTSGTVSYTMVDVAGDQILQEWRAADGTLAFRITDQGPIGGVAGPVFNVKAFGATGDGATDDTTAIQAAVTAAVAAGGEVFIPPATAGYLVTADIVCDPGNNGVVMIRGVGYGSMILCGAANINCFYIDPGTSNFQQAYIKGLRFEMGAYDSRAIFWEQNGQHGVVSDIWVDGSASQLGGLIEIGLAASASGAVCTFLRDLRIRGGGAAAGIRFTDQFHSVTFENVEVTGCVNAIDNDTTDATTASNINVLNCRLDDGTSGIVLRTVTLAGLSVIGTRFENNTAYGIDLQGFDATSNRMLNVNLIGNYFTSFVTGRVGVRAHRIVGFNLIGNVFRSAAGSAGQGIGLEFVSGVTQVTILNNSTSPSVNITSTITGYTGVPLGRDDLFVNQTSVLWSAPRYIGSGTAHVAGDYAASANWGTSPTITPLARDTGGRVSVLAQATTGANPTLTLTFSNGTWTTAPAVSCSRGDALATAGYWTLTSVSATGAVFTFVGTPVAGETYILDFVAMGK